MTNRSRAANVSAGFSVVELLIATAVTLTVTAGVFALLNPAQGTFRVQPEVADLQQRLRVGLDSLTKDLVNAGAGPGAGPSVGPLLRSFAPVLPYRVGVTNSDPAAGRFYRPDVMSVLYVPSTGSHAALREGITSNSQEFTLNILPNCPRSRIDQLCGFQEKMRVLLFDASGAWDLMTVAAAVDPTVRVTYSGSLSAAYGAGATVTQVVSRTYYLKADPSSGAFQLMLFDGDQGDFPLLDNVVKLTFSYYGTPEPPALLPGTSLEESVGPFTTYGPRPPSLGRDNANDSWPAGENCVFSIRDGEHVPRLQVLAAGAGQVELPPASLTDGPWCTDAEHSNRFDADLLRVRRVRATLRVQTAAATLRGPAGVLFARAGTATAGGLVPDQELTVDVTPRNLNLGR